jgi:hypothetical protein
LKAAGIDGTMAVQSAAGATGSIRMPFWQRLIITVLAMLAASYIIGLIWTWVSGFALPSYLGGVIGGLTALPVWEFLKRIGPKPPAPAAY